MYCYRYIPDLRRPASRLEIVTIVLVALSVVFLLIGGLGMVVTIPMKSGEPWMLGLSGLALMFVAMPCMLIIHWQGRRREQLRCGGFPVPGRVVKMTCHISVSYGSGAGVRKRHPWTVWCEYRYEGQTYTVRSTFLWDEPAGTTAKVFLDQLHPERAWVDPKSLQYKLTLR